MVSLPRTKVILSATGSKVVVGNRLVVSTMENHVLDNQDKKLNHFAVMLMIRAAMSKEERKKSSKKRKEDPNPNRTGKARNVTQESYSNWRTEIELDEGVAHAIRLGLAAGTAIGGAVIGKKAHDAIKGMTDRRNKRLDDALKKARGIREGRYL